jgi:hypothetical protein
MNMVTVGIDLAKNIFALHGVDQSGKAVLVKPKVWFCSFPVPHPQAQKPPPFPISAIIKP